MFSRAYRCVLKCYGPSRALSLAPGSIMMIWESQARNRVVLVKARREFAHGGPRITCAKQGICGKAGSSGDKMRKGRRTGPFLEFLLPIGLADILLGKLRVYPRGVNRESWCDFWCGGQKALLFQRGRIFREGHRVKKGAGCEQFWHCAFKTVSCQRGLDPCGVKACVERAVW